MLFSHRCGEWQHWPHPAPASVPFAAPAAASACAASATSACTTAAAALPCSTCPARADSTLQRRSTAHNMAGRLKLSMHRPAKRNTAHPQHEHAQPSTTACAGPHGTSMHTPPTQQCAPASTAQHVACKRRESHAVLGLCMTAVVCCLHTTPCACQGGVMLCVRVLRGPLTACSSQVQQQGLLTMRPLQQCWR